MFVCLFAFLPVSFVCLFICLFLFVSLLCLFFSLSLHIQVQFVLSKQKRLNREQALKPRMLTPHHPIHAEAGSKQVQWRYLQALKIHHTNFGDPWPMISTHKNPGMSYPGLPLLYIPILRMGLEPSILFDREGSGFLGPGHRSGLALRQAYLVQPHKLRTLHGLPLVLKVTFPDTSAFGGSDSRCCQPACLVGMLQRYRDTAGRAW